MKNESYHEYVFQQGKFIGAFEDMYQHVDDPWHHGDATDIQYDMVLYLLARFFGSKCPQRILDLGCGKGAFTARLHLAYPEAALTAVDIAQTAIAKARLRPDTTAVDYVAMDVRHLPLPLEGRFDCIVLSQLLWYVLPEFGRIMQHLIDDFLVDHGVVVINQTFYAPGVQKYGTEIISSVEEMIALVPLSLQYLLESNRIKNHNAIVLFSKNGR